MSRYGKLNTYGGGRAGQSAYEIYVEVERAAGRVPLAKEAWLESLKGEGAYDDTELRGRVTQVEASVVTAQSRADAAYSLAQQGGGGSGDAYDDTEVRGLIGAVDDKVDANTAAIAALGPTAWVDVTGKPTAFPPATHNHQIAEVGGLQAALDGKAPIASVMTVEQVQDLVAAMFQSGTHTNAVISYDDASGTISVSASGGGTGGGLTQEQVEDIVGSLVQVQGTGISVVYDDAGNVLTISLTGETYTTAEKSKLASVATGATANASDAELRNRSMHTGTQAIGTVDGLQTALDGKAATTHSHNWSAITGKPTTFAPSAHAHAIADVTGLQTALDGKAATSHSHAIADVSGLQTALDGKQPTTTFKTVNGQTITGSGDIVTAVSFATDAEAEAYSAANPGAVVFSREVV